MRVQIRVDFDHFPKIRNELKPKVGVAVAKVAHDIEGDAKQNIQSNGQIDTGAMLNSTQAEQVDMLNWRVVVAVEYAIYQERGTRFMAGRPFLIPAAEANRENFKDSVGVAVGK